MIDKKEIREQLSTVLPVIEAICERLNQKCQNKLDILDFIPVPTTNNLLERERIMGELWGIHKLYNSIKVIIMDVIEDFLVTSEIWEFIEQELNKEENDNGENI